MKEFAAKAPQKSQEQWRPGSVTASELICLLSSSELLWLIAEPLNPWYFYKQQTQISLSDRPQKLVEQVLRGAVVK